jgi:hypothetical protein
VLETNLTFTTTRFSNTLSLVYEALAGSWQPVVSDLLSKNIFTVVDTEQGIIGVAHGKLYFSTIVLNQHFVLLLLLAATACCYCLLLDATATAARISRADFLYPTHVQN